MRSRALESAEKLRGAYYTPPPLAQALAHYALAQSPARVLEPCCGDGALLQALAARPSTARIDAIEIDPRAARTARTLAPSFAAHGARLTVVRDEFFAWLARQPASRQWDAVVANPPYVRYQYLDAAQRDRAAEACARAGVTLSKRTNAWVPFVVAAASRLAPGGRLAMVIPAEILHVIHADGLRRMLERTMREVTLVHLRAMVFPGVLQGVVLLLAERGETEGHGAALRVLDVDDAPGLAAAVSTPARDPAHALEGRWTRALLTRDEASLLARIERADWAVRFTDVARVDIGVVTGANAFFLANETTIARHGLASVAHAAVGRSEQVRGLRYEAADHAINARDGRPVFLLRMPAARRDLTRPMRAYLRAGEADGLDQRYKCRIRTPWWDVPYVWSAPVAMLKRCHDHPRLVLNTAGAVSTDTAYRIRLHEPHAARARDLVGSFANSLSFLLAELEGRSYGGGVLELVPSEIERLRIPVTALDTADFDALDAQARTSRQGDALVARGDALVLGHRLRSHETEQLRAAWQRLRARRLRRA